ncbi:MULTISPECIES: hypothetical protein [Lachnospiraceae]|uniref:hypothetical protein n=1 Tax=Lachnospiraceae TaxID=186803 RepID=UPI000E433E60|nr:hypothetical protein [Hungatella hathewayi]RGO65951.1 hypothetical protein DXB08_28920 [Hungatella hathewayi]
MEQVENSKTDFENLILNMIKEELDPSDDRLKKMKARLKSASLDEVERLYDAFARFGVQNIFNEL